MLKHLLIVEDHPICVTALTMAIQTRDSTVVVDHCDSVARGRDLLRSKSFGALVLDLGLADSSGLFTLVQMRAEEPDLPILIVSADESDGTAMRARAGGAQGFLSKSAPVTEMGEAIATVLNGAEYFKGDNEPNSSARMVAEDLSALSRAQLRVMSQLAAGKPNKIIASDLGLAEGTVKSHISAIFRALQVTNRAGAILRLQEINRGAMIG